MQALRAQGVQVEEREASRVLEEDPEALAGWPQRRCREAVLALDLGGDPALTPRVRGLQERLGIPWVVWFLDDPEGYGFPECCAPRWTISFCWDMAISRELSRAGPLHVDHLPLACDPSLFNAKRGRKLSPCLEGVFVGSTAHPNPFLEEAARGCPTVAQAAKELWLRHREDMAEPIRSLAWHQAATKAGRPEEEIRLDPLWRLWVHACLHLAGRMKRVEVVQRVLGRGGAIFGDPAWADHLDAVPYLGPLEYGPAIENVYSSSSFVLEVRQPQSRGGLSQRVFDASACGRPLVAEWSTELEHLFHPSKEIFTYRSIPQAEEARDRCLRFPAEASRMAHLARQTVLARHTFAHRARLLLDILRKESS